MSTSNEIIKVLLVEDDEDDYILTRMLLSEIGNARYQLEWKNTYEEGLVTMALNQHQVCLIDYRLGGRTGLDLLRAAVERGCQSPIIVLTGQEEHEIDIAAMQSGAADYLVKGQLKPDLLERSIRYALERKRSAALAAFEQARLAAFGADIGLALTRNESLPNILNRCSEAVVHYLGAALAQIWIWDSDRPVLNLRGCAFEKDRRAHEKPDSISPALDLDTLAQGQPLLVKNVAADSPLGQHEWIRAEGIVSYVAYPLMLEGRLIGVMALFTRMIITETVFQEMESVAHGIALFIERLRTREALDVSESKYRTVVENIKEVIFQMDEFGHWKFLNPAWTEMTGFEVTATQGTPFLDYVHRDDRDRNRFILLQLIERKLDFCRYETRYLTKDGQFRWVEAYAQLLFGNDGTPAGITGTLTDITERKQAEMQIQKLAAFPRFNPNPILEFSPDAKLTYANDAAQKLAASLELDLAQLLPANHPQIIQECLQSGQTHSRLQTTHGKRTISWSFFPIVAGQVVHCYGADITEMLNLEAQFRHAQKLESIGQLAAGVAHDFNNILTVIQGHADLLQARGDLNEVTRNQLREIALAADRATSLTRQLLMFSRKQVIQTQVLDLNATTQGVAKMIARLLGEHITLKTTYSEVRLSLEADAGMVEQVLMNLAVNARDAMPNGGTLFIETGLVELPVGEAARHPEARAGKFISLSVRDSGCGMDTTTLQRIFEPFFTTKSPGKGTGLGLATVYGIVKQHHGWIEVESVVNNGTTFKIFLPPTGKSSPVIHVEETPAAAVSRNGNGNGHAETLLIVEDELALRALVKDLLKESGYHVLEASNGAEALQVWDRHEGRINLLLTDIVMPEGMTGFELADRLVSRDPSIRVVYTSGYSAEVAGYDLGFSDKVFLPKPYSLQKLARVIRDSLDHDAKDSGAKPAVELVLS